MNKVGWWRVLFWVALVLLPGAMLALPLVLLLLGRRRASGEMDLLSTEAPSPVPVETDLAELAPSSTRVVQLANA